MQSMLSSSLLNTAAGLLSLAAGLGSSVIVARLLGVEGAGIVAYALWIMSVATLVSGLGIPQTLLRFIARTDGTADKPAGLANVLTKAFTLSTLSLAAAMLAYAGWLWLDGDVAHALIWSASTLLFVAYAYSTMSLAAAEGLGRFRESTFYASLGCVIQPLAILAGSLLLGPAGAILGHVLRHVPQALSLRRYMVPPRPATEVCAPVVTPVMKSYARDNWLSGGLSAVLSSRIELAIIGFYFALADVGYYAIGITMTGMVIQVALFLIATLVPYLGHHFDRGDVPALSRVYNRSLLGLVLVLAPIGFGGAAIAPQLIPMLFGAEFEPAVGVSVVLLVFCVSQAIEYVPSRLLLAAERSRDALVLSIVGGLVSVALLLLVVPHYGGIGAAWAKGGVSIATVAFYMWYGKARLGVTARVASLAKVLVSAALCAVAARVVMDWLGGLPGMGLAILVGGVVYVLVLLISGAIPPEDRRLVADWAGERIPGQFAGIVRRAILVGQSGS